MKLIDVLRAGGWPGAELGNALGVVSLESGGNPNAHNTSGEDSRGLFQINVGPGAHPQWAGANLYDPVTNARYAYQLYAAAGNYRDWWNAAGILGLPPRGTYRHAVEEYASLANKELGNGGAVDRASDGKVGLVLIGGAIVLALIVWG